MFQALQLAGEKTASHREFQSFLAANLPLYRYLLEGYLGFQYLAIRRLTDATSKNDEEKLRGTVSIHRLLFDMAAHSEYITREIFVSFDGLPYEYEEILAQNEEEWLDKIIQEGSAWSEEPAAARAAQRHEMFDQLSGVPRESRKRKDLINKDFWKDCKKALNKPELTSIKYFTNKFLAHAADEASIGTLRDQDKMWSIEKIHEAQKILRKSITQLSMYFFDIELLITPVYGKDELTFNFSKPFIPEEIETEVHQELQRQMDDFIQS